MLTQTADVLSLTSITVSSSHGRRALDAAVYMAKLARGPWHPIRRYIDMHAEAQVAQMLDYVLVFVIYCSCLLELCPCEVTPADRVPVRTSSVVRGCEELMGPDHWSSVCQRRVGGDECERVDANVAATAESHDFRDRLLASPCVNCCF